MSSRPFVAARIERWIDSRVAGIARRLGWRERVINYTGYGNLGMVRVLARVVLAPGRSPMDLLPEDSLARRGWRNFVILPSVRARGTMTIGDQVIPVVADPGGYIDVSVVAHGLTPGWNTVTIRTTSSDPTDCDVMVIGDDATFGIVSDIDDTIISTSLPRPLIAAWNSLILAENARTPVPGMAAMYTELLSRHPGSPVVYVSTGAWNTQAFLHRFLKRHGFPDGPLLLTDWGPTNTGWFRSGRAHKAQSLRHLASDFPHVRWLLIGDDGQHDPTVYGQFALEHPDVVRGIVIRELNPVEQVLAHGTTERLDADHSRSGPVPVVRGPDGRVLAGRVRAILDGE